MDEFYIESDFTSTEGYKVPADRDHADSGDELEHDPGKILVIPYRVIVKTARHAPSCWYELSVDGQRVWGKPLENNKTFTVSGYKDADIVRELVFSFPTKSGNQEQTLSGHRLQQLGEIKLRCCRATFTHYKAVCFTNQKWDGHVGQYTGTANSFKEATKRDVHKSTGGEYSIATTRVGQELFRFVDTGRQDWAWRPQYRRGEFVDELSVKYRPRQTLIDLGIKLFSKPVRPQDTYQDPKVLPTLGDSENTNRNGTLGDSENTNRNGPTVNENLTTNVDQASNVTTVTESMSLEVPIKKRYSTAFHPMSAIPEDLEGPVSESEKEIRSPVHKKLKKRTSLAPANMEPTFPDADPLLTTDKIKKRQSIIPPQTVPVFPDGTVSVTVTEKTGDKVMRTVKMRRSVIPSPKAPSFPGDEACVPCGFVKPSPSMVMTRSMRRRLSGKALADIKNIPLPMSPCKKGQVNVESEDHVEEWIILDETQSSDDSLIYMGDEECEIVDVPTPEITIIDLENIDLNA